MQSSLLGHYIHDTAIALLDSCVDGLVDCSTGRECVSSTIDASGFPRVEAALGL